MKKQKWKELVPRRMMAFVLLAVLIASTAQASVIPDKYDYVTLPKSTETEKYSAFTAINNNGLAVGYGYNYITETFAGFVYDFENKKVLATTADFFPLSINDNNTVAGISLIFPSYFLSTCVITAGECKIQAIEGTERPFLANGFSITNSNITSGTFFYNQTDEQFRLYRSGKIIYNVLTAASPDLAGQLHYDIQRNNTRLFVGAFVNNNGLKSPFVKILDNDNSVRTLHLPNPDPARSAIATSVNSRNDIIISTVKTATEASSIYLCRFVESLSAGEEASCQGGLIYLGDSEFDGYSINRIALNDRGLLVTPGRIRGIETQLYDLTQPQPVPVPLASKGMAAEIFATQAPLQVNNNGVILMAPNTVLLVPVKPAEPYTVTVKQEDVEIPYDGTRMQFSESITNTSTETRNLLYWRILNFPDGTPYSRGSVKRVQLAPDETFSDTRVRLGIRHYMPAGNYEYRLYVMDQENGEILSDRFRITKLP